MQHAESCRLPTARASSARTAARSHPFARLVEPDNAALAAREEAARALRAEGTPTVPSRLELERMTNPFLRWTAPGVLAAAERRCGSPVSDPAAVFAEIRGWKDNA